ncbi:MAG TPA: hypothetical protein VHA57_09690 [Actinomycetota bacterium]|nr:hypothetical protein [Actinomycetota bacterium]
MSGCTGNGAWIGPSQGWQPVTRAPARQLVFVRDSPKLPRALPRYLPANPDQALIRVLERSPNRIRADALLLRATGLRTGELVDLEIDKSFLFALRAACSPRASKVAHRTG